MPSPPFEEPRPVAAGHFDGEFDEFDDEPYDEDDEPYDEDDEFDEPYDEFDKFDDEPYDEGDEGEYEDAGDYSAAGTFERALRLVYDRGPESVLVGMVGLYWLIFGFLVYRQQSNFGTFGFDIGIHDQGIWLVSRFKTPFDTVRGLDYFAHHVDVISLVFVPFYWLGAGPHFLIIAHTLVVAAGAIPLWLLARDRLQDRWFALVPAFAYLMYPAVNWVTWWAYHPDSLSIAPLLFAYWLAVRGKWKWFAVAAFIALMCKEDDALSILMLGLVVAFWLRRARTDQVPNDRRQRRLIGLATTAAGAAWYLLCTRVIIPWRNHGMPPFYNSFFPLLGRTIPGVIYNSMRHPSRVWHLATLDDRKTYYLQMGAPLAFLPILALPIFLIGGPQFGVDITAQVVQGATIKSQYASLVLVGAFLATVEALAFIKRHWSRVLPVALGVIVACTMWGQLSWGLSPISTQYHTGIWLAHNSLSTELNTALGIVPRDAGVSVTYYLTPHFTHRVYVFEFPNPWMSVNYGVNNARGNPADVQYLVLDRATLGPFEQTLLLQLTGPGGGFQVVYSLNGIIVARRMSG
ncbi:MAG: DUF2079 domain-containing protein [Acidimicrobiales bacterium]